MGYRFQFNDYGRASNDAFFGDAGDRQHILPGGAQLDAAANFGNSGDFTVHNTAVAAVGATSITVSALPESVPAGTTLEFTGGKFAVTTATAAAGATSLAVEPLGEQIADESDAVVDTVAGEDVVVSGTLVGRTVAERNAGAAFGPAADADDEIYITIGDSDLARAVDGRADVDLIRHGSLIKVNFLPAYAAASSAIKTKLEAFYELQLG